MKARLSVSWAARMSQTLDRITEILSKGGPTMWPLLALSVITLALILERSIFWLRTHRPGRAQWVLDVVERLRAGDEPGVRAMAATDRTIYSRIVKSLLDIPVHPALAVEIAERYRSAFDRYSAWLSTTVTAGPLLGILGSVSGIIRSLGLLGGGGHASSVEAAAAGIAEALIATGFGLAIALVTLFPYMIFRAQIDRAIGNIELLVAARQSAGKGLRRET